jgi:hypothetical protein
MRNNHISGLEIQNLTIPEVTRRQFLDSLKFGTIFFGLGHDIVEAQEIQNTDSWATGLDKLRASALVDDFEIAAQFISKKQQPGRWASSVKGRTGGVVVNLDPVINKAIQDGYSRVLNIHTHTLKSAQRARKRRESLERFLVPPSFLGLHATGDLGYALSAENDYGSKIDLENGIIDPAGLWIFKVDRKHDFYKKYIIAKGKLLSVAIRITQITKISPQFLNYVEQFKELSAGIYLILEKHSSSLSPEELEFCKNGFKDFRELFEVDYKERVQKLIQIDLSYAQGTENLAGLIGAHKAIGIDIKFLTYEQAKQFAK